ncbi:MAG: MarR family winged helix-turn-helix transcriptional regulator [Solidesulfovibrio sp.]
MTVTKIGKTALTTAISVDINMSPMDGSQLTPDDIRPFPLRESLGFLLVRTALRLRLLGNTLLQEAGEDITVDQWGILNLLWEADGQTPVELARRADKDKPNVTRLLKILEDKALVVRQPDPNDRRSHRIYLTESGNALKDKLLDLGTTCLERACLGLSSQEVATFKSLLNRVYANVS